MCRQGPKPRKGEKQISGHNPSIRQKSEDSKGGPPILDKKGKSVFDTNQYNNHVAQQEGGIMKRKEEQKMRF